MKKKYIYPEVGVETVLLKAHPDYRIEDTWRVTLETYLRKKYRGKYYLWKVWNEIYCPAHELMVASIVDAVNRFHDGVYRNHILGKISLKIEIEHPMMPRKRLFELDPDQTPEEERLTPKI